MIVSFLLGVTFGIFNIVSWRWIVPRLLGNIKSSKILVSFVAVSKLLLVACLLWFAVSKNLVDPLAFLLGLSSIVTLIFVFGLRKPSKE